jgi:hypothetical protein
MNHRSELFAALKEDFQRWEGLLAGLDEEQVLAPLPSSHWNTKDVIAHLRAWQQVSIARLEAALSNEEPEFPEWLGGRDPDAEDDVHKCNESIYQAFREDPWASVHRLWKQGFLRFLDLAETIPEQDLLQVSGYSWLKEYPLSAVISNSHDHHKEHFEALLALFGEQKA